MIVRKLRLQRGWSQSQLAELTGLATRTIQRLEKGQQPSLETAGALASVFEVDLSTFQTEDGPDMNSSDDKLKRDEQEALLYAKRLKEFYEFLWTYLILAVVFFVVFPSHMVLYLVFGGIGIGLVVQGLIAFEKIPLLSPRWERRLVEKRLGRKL